MLTQVTLEADRVATNYLGKQNKLYRKFLNLFSTVYDKVEDVFFFSLNCLRQFVLFFPVFFKYF